MITIDNDTKKLIVKNLLNGVPTESIARVFKVSPEDVVMLFDEAVKRVAAYRIARLYPNLDIGTIEKAKANKMDFLHTLDRISFDSVLTLRRYSVISNLDAASMNDAILSMRG